MILADSERLIAAYHERGDGRVDPDRAGALLAVLGHPEIMRDSAAARRAARRTAAHPPGRDHRRGGRSAWRCSACAPSTTSRASAGCPSRTWLGHGIHFNDEEIARLGAAGTAVAHCPSSNMRLASGIARAVELEDAGAPVGHRRGRLRLQRRLQPDPRGAPGALPAAAAVRRRAGHPGARPRLGHQGLGPGARARRPRRDRARPQADLALFRLDELRFSGSHDPLVGPAALRCRPGRPGDGRRPSGGSWTGRSSVSTPSG